MSRYATTSIGLLMLVLSGAVYAQSETEPQAEPAAPAGYIAEVTGDDVYVRSGPSTNYYPVVKLDAGSRVRVLDRSADWLAIEPPDGCYSLMAEQFVDTGDGVRGVVNGNNVFVRIGSTIQPDAKYARQMKLSRGAEVEILNRQDDGYYRIVPPAGAKLWISGEYVQRVPDELLELEAASRDAAVVEPVAEGTEAESPVAEAEAGEEVEPISPDDLKAKVVDFRKQIDEADVALQAELSKPVAHRELQPILDRFAPLAEQQDDEFSRLYAETRIAQITDMMDLVEAVRQVRDLGDQVQATRRDAMAARANIRPKSLTMTEGFDAQGELRLSAVYDSAVGPLLYRLVDPSTSPIRTVGYVEVPVEAGIDVTEYLGRYVGIRARDVMLQRGEVDPISVYVAADIVALETSGPEQPVEPTADSAIVEHP